MANMKTVMLIFSFLCVCMGGYAQISWAALNEQGQQLYTSGNYDEAIKVFEKAKMAAEKEFGKKHSNYASVCNNLAVVYRIQDLYDKAEKLHIEAKEIHFEILPQDSLGYAESCDNLAALYHEKTIYHKAEPLYKEAKEIRLKVLGKKHQDYGLSCANLATLYNSQGLYAQAVPLFLEAKEVCINNSQKDVIYARVCEGLATSYQEQELYNKAEFWFIEAKAIYLKVLGKNDMDYALACNNLANLYVLKKKYDQAYPLYEEVLANYSTNYGEDHADYATFCYNLGVLYFEQDVYDKAEKLFIKVKAIYLQTVGQEHPDYAMLCNGLGLLYARQGLYAKAEPLWVESINIKIKHIQSSFINLSEQEKRQYLAAEQHYFENYHSFIAEIIQKQPDYNLQILLQNLVNLQLQTKAMLLGETQKMKKRILTSKNTTLINNFESWQLLKNNIAKAYNLSIIERKRKRIDIAKLENEANEIERALAITSIDFAKAFSPKNYTYQDLQNQLKADEVAIEIINIEADSSYLAMFIGKSDLQVINLGKNRLLESALKAYNDSIMNLKDTKSFYNIFWKPFLSSLKGAKKVYFCPDGIYHRLSLNTLQNPETKQFLGEEISMTMIGNLKDIFQNNTSNPKKTAELFGKPNYKRTKQQQKRKENDWEEDKNLDIFVGIKNINFKTLPGTATEVKEIATFLEKEKYKIGLFLEIDAAEEQLKATNSPKILHIATHGYFVLNSTNKSNEMLSSGIVLAGVNDLSNTNAEDGVLTAYEASTLNLDNTDLVVLSACQTGLGEVSSGEGVYGLQRGFKVAGAKAIMMSLWEVNDLATQDFMSIFYTNWLKTGNKKQALLAAQATVRAKISENKDYSHPYYWGAFVMIGE